MNQPSIEDTIAFIERAHAGVLDDSGALYFLHPIAVMKRLPDGASIEQKLAALLHDVIEDTEYTKEDLLKMGYSPRTVDLVVMVTQGKDESYIEYIKRIVDSNDREATELKFADMSENMDPERHAKLSQEQRNEFTKKYAVPKRMLTEKLKELQPAIGPAL